MSGLRSIAKSVRQKGWRLQLAKTQKILVSCQYTKSGFFCCLDLGTVHVTWCVTFMLSLRLAFLQTVWVCVKLKWIFLENIVILTEWRKWKYNEIQLPVLYGRGRHSPEKLQFQPLGDFLCIPTWNTGQLNPLFHTFAKFRLIVNGAVHWSVGGQCTIFS